MVNCFVVEHPRKQFTETGTALRNTINELVTQLHNRKGTVFGQRIGLGNPSTVNWNRCFRGTSVYIEKVADTGPAITSLDRQ